MGVLLVALPGWAQASANPSAFLILTVHCLLISDDDNTDVNHMKQAQCFEVFESKSLWINVLEHNELSMDFAETLDSFTYLVKEALFSHDNVSKVQMHVCENDPGMERYGWKGHLPSISSFRMIELTSYFVIVWMHTGKCQPKYWLWDSLGKIQMNNAFGCWLQHWISSMPTHTQAGCKSLLMHKELILKRFFSETMKEILPDGTEDWIEMYDCYRQTWFSTVYKFWI